MGGAIPGPEVLGSVSKLSKLSKPLGFRIVEANIFWEVFPQSQCTEANVLGGQGRALCCSKYHPGGAGSDSVKAPRGSCWSLTEGVTQRG